MLCAAFLLAFAHGDHRALVDQILPDGKENRA